MKLASVSYLPPPDFLGVEQFRSNLAKYRSAFPIVTYSDHDYGGEVVKLKGSPEGAKAATFRSGELNKFAVNNVCFFTGVRIAKSMGYTHFIYLETDVRIGRDHWDMAIFEEYFSQGKPVIGGGTLACYNPSNFSRLAAKRWEDLIRRNVRRNVPVPTYLPLSTFGWMGAGKKANTCVFPNGALSVVDIGWIEKLFVPFEETIQLGMKVTAWDMEIGNRIWETFHEDAFDVLAHLDCIYSGFGDVITTMEERLEMLRSGQIVAGHQFKGNVSYP